MGAREGLPLLVYGAHALPSMAPATFPDAWRYPEVHFYVFRRLESVYDVHFPKFNHLSIVLLIRPFMYLGAIINDVSVPPSSYGSSMTQYMGMDPF